MRKGTCDYLICHFTCHYNDEQIMVPGDIFIVVMSTLKVGLFNMLHCFVECDTERIYCGDGVQCPQHQFCEFGFKYCMPCSFICHTVGVTPGGQQKSEEECDYHCSDYLMKQKSLQLSLIPIPNTEASPSSLTERIQVRTSSDNHPSIAVYIITQLLVLICVIIVVLLAFYVYYLYWGKEKSRSMAQAYLEALNEHANSSGQLQRSGEDEMVIGENITDASSRIVGASCTRIGDQNQEIFVLASSGIGESIQDKSRGHRRGVHSEEVVIEEQTGFLQNNYTANYGNALDLVIDSSV